MFFWVLLGSSGFFWVLLVFFWRSITQKNTRKTGEKPLRTPEEHQKNTRRTPEVGGRGAERGWALRAAGRLTIAFGAAGLGPFACRYNIPQGFCSGCGALLSPALLFAILVVAVCSSGVLLVFFWVLLVFFCVIERQKNARRTPEEHQKNTRRTPEEHQKERQKNPEEPRRRRTPAPPF